MTPRMREKPRCSTSTKTTRARLQNTCGRGRAGNLHLLISRPVSKLLRWRAAAPTSVPQPFCNRAQAALPRCCNRARACDADHPGRDCPESTAKVVLTRFDKAPRSVRRRHEHRPLIRRRRETPRVRTGFPGLRGDPKWLRWGVTSCRAKALTRGVRAGFLTGVSPRAEDGHPRVPWPEGGERWIAVHRAINGPTSRHSRFLPARGNHPPRDHSAFCA
jgi:hypothetical protein